VLVGHARDPEPLEPMARALAAALGDALHSLWWNGQPERSNAILGPHWRLLHPVDEARGVVRETIGGVAVFFPPGAFGQANLDLADRVVERIHAWAPEGARVAELYAGCGPIGLGLLARSTEVVFVESAPDAVRGLALGIAARPPTERARARVLAVGAAEAVPALEGAGLVIADPPRKGLDAALLDALQARPPRTLVVVSCDLGSFEADTARLLGRGAFRLVDLEAWALFPNTSHVETLARFERAGAGR
jgi:23S rRNA (uracil1939-C5)-methyltransferase